MQTVARDDRILPLTRAAAGAVALVLLAGGILLYVWPADTERLFAWTITPSMTPLFMGSGYAMGAYFWARAVTATRWHHIGSALVPTTLFAWLMLIATLLHWGRFSHGHVTFWLWLGVYLITPVLVPLVWFLNQRTDPGTPDPGDVETPAALRWILTVGGAAELALGLTLFIAPNGLIGVWPWQLTPLTARAIGGWYATAGLAGLVVARDRRWSTYRLLFQGSLIWLTLLLIGLLRGWNDLRPSSPLTWVYAASLCFFTVVLAAFYLSLEARKPRQTLGSAPSAVAHAHEP